MSPYVYTCTHEENWRDWAQQRAQAGVLEDFIWRRPRPRESYMIHLYLVCVFIILLIVVQEQKGRDEGEIFARVISELERRVEETFRCVQSYLYVYAQIRTLGSLHSPGYSCERPARIIMIRCHAQLGYASRSRSFLFTLSSSLLLLLL